MHRITTGEALTLGAVLFSLHEGSPAPVMAPVPGTTTSVEGAATTKDLSSIYAVFFFKKETFQA